MKKVQSIKKTSFGLLAAALVAFAALPATAGAMQPSAAKAAKPGSQTITQIVVSSPDFDVLEAAVVKAGLAGVLDGKKQYTVFAPNDMAFMKTLGATSEAEAIAKVNALPNDALTNILLYHVTNGRRISTSVLSAPGYKMINGDKLYRSELTNSGVVATDISARNGIVHVIGSVLMPE